MSCFLPYPFTNLSKCILISWPMLLFTGIVEPPSGRPLHAISPTLHNTLCTPLSLPFRGRHKSFCIVTLKLPSSTIRDILHHWLFDIFHILLHPDRSSMTLCSLQLLCPGSSSPMRTDLDGSLHRDQKTPPESVSLRKSHRVLPNLHASQQNSAHHSTPQTPAIIKPRVMSN